MAIKVLGEAAFLPLTRKAPHLPRRYALIDIEDFERVTRSKWYATPAGYVRATSGKFLAAHHMTLHRYVCRVEREERLDHESGDTLDNRKQNLRVATAAENARNTRRQTFPGKTSRFKGVCWSARAERWLAKITANGERTYLGQFSSEEDAALAYDKAAVQLHGDFARTNATMALFDMDDPFVPDCSWASVFDRLTTYASLSPHHHILQPANYDRRLTERLRNEIAAAKAA